MIDLSGSHLTTSDSCSFISDVVLSHRQSEQRQTETFTCLSRACSDMF